MTGKCSCPSYFKLKNVGSTLITKFKLLRTQPTPPQTHPHHSLSPPPLPICTYAALHPPVTARPTHPTAHMLGGGGLRGKMTLSDSLSSSVTWGWRPVLREIDSVVKMCTVMGECTTALRTSTAQQQLLRATAGRCVSAVHRARTRHTAQLGAAGGGELLEGGNRLERYLQIIEIACAAIIERLNALEGKDKKELILNALEEFIAIEVKHAEGASARCLRAQVESCERWCDKNVFPAGGNMTVDTVGSSALDDAVGLDEFGDDGESDGEEEEESDAEGGGVGSGEENENENEDDRDGGGRSSFSAKARTPFLPEERNYVDNVRPMYWIAIEALCSRLEVLHSSGSASHAIAASGRAVLGRHTVIWNGLDIDVRNLPASRALRAAPRASIPRPTVHHSARLRLGDPTLPVVLLLGWWRSRPALLEKYAALYAARGFGTLALSATTFDMAAAPLAFLGLGLSAGACCGAFQTHERTAKVYLKCKRCVQLLLVLTVLGGIVWIPKR